MFVVFENMNLRHAPLLHSQLRGKSKSKTLRAPIVPSNSISIPGVSPVKVLLKLLNAGILKKRFLNHLVHCLVLFRNNCFCIFYVWGCVFGMQDIANNSGRCLAADDDDDQNPYEFTRCLNMMPRIPIKVYQFFEHNPQNPNESILRFLVYSPVRKPDPPETM